MKRYLNREEKHLVLVLGAFVSFCREQADKLKGVWGTPQGVTTNLKTAATHGDKAMRAYLQTLDRVELAKVVAENKKMQVAARYTSEAVAEYEAIAKLDTTVNVHRDDFDTFMEWLIDAHCKTCRLKGDQAELCSIRVLMIKYDVPVFDCEAPVGKCPYQYTE